MSVVSLARMAGLTPVPWNTPSSTSASMLEAEASRMSTMSCLTMSAHSLEEFRAGAQSRRRAVGGADRADGVQARAHVGVLGVGDDEIAAAVLAGADAGELFVQSRHVGSWAWDKDRVLERRDVARNEWSLIWNSV